jgi:hypothetical protein
VAGPLVGAISLPSDPFIDPRIVPVKSATVHVHSPLVGLLKQIGVM